MTPAGILFVLPLRVMAVRVCAAFLSSCSTMWLPIWPPAWAS